MNRKFDEIHNLKDIEKLKNDIDQKIAQLQKEREEADNYYTDFLYSHAVTFDELIEPLTDKELVRLDELCASDIKLPLEMRFNAKLSSINGILYIKSKYINGFNIRELIKDFEKIKDNEILNYNFNQIINSIDELIFHVYCCHNNLYHNELDEYRDGYWERHKDTELARDKEKESLTYLDNLDFLSLSYYHILHGYDFYTNVFPIDNIKKSYKGVINSFKVLQLGLYEKFNVTENKSGLGNVVGYVFYSDESKLRYHFNNDINKIVGISIKPITELMFNYKIKSIYFRIPIYYERCGDLYGHTFDYNFLDINEL